MTDPYAWWRQALAGTAANVNINEPQCGFYRRKVKKGGPWIAAAIWPDPESPGQLLCRVGDDVEDPSQQWSWLAKNPIAEDVALKWFDTKQWPHETGPAPIGHNAPVAETPFDQMAVDAKLLIDNVNEWLGDRQELATEADATKASDKAGELRKLWNAADKLRKEEKEPHLEAGRAVDKKFKLLLEPLALVAAKLQDLAKAWAVAEDKRRQEEAAAKEADPAVPWGEPAEAPEPVKVGGNVGRAIKVKTVHQIQVDDYTKMLRKVKDDPRIVALATQIAEELLLRGERVPGAQLVEVRIAA